jgi:hypothetical protein
MQTGPLWSTRKTAGSSRSWPSYWANSGLFLFFGETSKITGGKLYNQVDGSTDWLTVAGSPNTFQCPNTAPYIAADTDYIWFKTDASQRTATQAELVGYDFPRTPVKYDDNSPYAIREILILKAGETLTADELKLVYPQDGAEPEIYESYLTENFLLQPMDGPDSKRNTESAIEYCLNHPKWKLSVQTHKILGIR